MQPKLYLRILLALSIIFSCMHDSSSKIMVGGKYYSIKCKSENNSEFMYFAECADQKLGIALYVKIDNDSVKSIKIGCNPIYKSEKKSENIKKTVPVNNADQLQFIDAVCGQLNKKYVLKSCEIHIFPCCLGDASYELMEKRNMMNTYREALQSLSFYKELTIILKKHKFKVTDIYICDVYPEDSDIIEKFCIVSDSNKNKVYAADADIRVYVEHE